MAKYSHLIEHPDVQGVLFDMDGTLLASNDARVWAWNSALQRHGMSMPKELYLQLTGKKGSDILETLCVQQGKQLSEEEKQQIIHEETELFKNEGLRHSPPIPAIVDLAKDAKAKGLRVAVATGSEAGVANKVMQDYKLNEIFSTVVSGKDVKHAKPQPDIFHAAAERIGLKASNCVILEDSKTGLEAATAAGAVRVIDVKQLPEHPEYQGPK